MENNQELVGQPEKIKKVDTGLCCLVMIAKMQGIPAEFEQLRRAYVVDAQGMDTMTMLRASKEIGLKARALIMEKNRFFLLPFPLVALLQNGNYVVVMKCEQEKVILLDPYRRHPEIVPLERFFEAWSQKVILFAKAGITEKQEKHFDLSWFIPVIFRYKKFLYQVLGLSFLLQIFGLISPMFTQVIIDKVLVHRSLSTLDVLVAGMAIVSLFQIWITGLRSYLFTHTTNKVDVVLSTKLFRHITALPLKYFSTWQVGDIVTRVRELDTVRQFITGSALTIVLDTIFTIVYVIAMFNYSRVLSLIVLLILPIYICLNLVITPIFRKRLNENFLAKSENQTFLIETVTGIQTAKTMAVEGQFAQKWELLLAKYIKSSFATANLGNFAGNIGSFIQQMFTVAVLWYGSHIVMKGEITIGELIAFQMMSGQVIAPVLRIVNMWQSFQQTKVSVDKLGDILNEEAEPAFDSTRTTLPSIQGNIVFDRVSFRYRADMAEVLYQLSIRIKAGSSVGIVGRSGSGKSTLTKMIQRLYVPESGRVLIDGVDLAQIEPAWLRRQVGVVLQENYLFSGSIRDNIAISSMEATMDDIIRVAKISGAHDFIEKLPQGYDTLTGERGTGLSGGERQRIAIARALLTNPRILIFDEATSALDFESEHIIMKNLKQISAGRTMIMIAHRLSTVQHCDQIIVIDHGRVAEAGSHEKLMQAKGLYYYLSCQQNREPEEKTTTA